MAKQLALDLEPPPPQTGRLARHEAVAWAVLERHAKKEGERSSLPVGTHSVRLEVTGTAAGEAFTTTIDGALNVAPDGSMRAKAEAVPAEQIVAWLLAELCDGDEERAAVLNKLPNVWRTALPALPKDEVEQAKQMLARLSVRTGLVPKRGDVKFAPAA